MTSFNMSDADCKAYNDALRHAARRAFDTSKSYWVYRAGTGTFYVRDSDEPAPGKANKVCIAQRWDDHTVQLRFYGARSEWVRF